MSVRAIYASPQDADIMLVGTFGAGVFRSRDAGQTWTPSNAGLTDLAVRDLAVDPRSGQVVYAATSTAGFFRSKDGGSNWLPINEGLPGLRTRSVYVDPVNSDRLLGTGPSVGVFELLFSPEPQIELDPSRLDFVSSSVGVVARLMFEVANTGGKELVVTSISPKGGLQPFSVSPTELVVEPEGKGQVEVRFFPQASGVQIDTLVIRSSDPDEPRVQLPLSATGVQAQLRGLPANLDFGHVLIGEFRDTTLVLSNGGNGPLTLNNAFFEDSAFRVLSFETGLVLQPGHTTLLPLRFVPIRATVLPAS